MAAWDKPRRDPLHDEPEVLRERARREWQLRRDDLEDERDQLRRLSERDTRLGWTDEDRAA